MLVSIKNRIAFLSNPKCGTTSIEHALRGECEIRMTSTAYFKHTDAVTFSKIWKPFLTKKLGIYNLLTICTTRSPSSKIVSWYKYRSRSQLKGSKRYLGDTLFRDFCSHSMQDQADKFFFDASANKPIVDIAIPIECMKILEDFVSKTFNIKAIPKINTSREVDSSSYAAKMTSKDYEQVIQEEAKKASKIYTESVIRHKLIQDFFSDPNHHINLRSAAANFQKYF